MFKIEKSINNQWVTVTTADNRPEAFRLLAELAHAGPGSAWRAIDARTGTAMGYPARYWERDR